MKEGDTSSDCPTAPGHHTSPKTELPQMDCTNSAGNIPVDMAGTRTEDMATLVGTRRASVGRKAEWAVQAAVLRCEGSPAGSVLRAEVWKGASAGHRGRRGYS